MEIIVFRIPMRDTMFGVSGRLQINKYVFRIPMRDTMLSLQGQGLQLQSLRF